MGNDEFNLDDAVAILERTPATLSALIVGVPERWLRATEGNGTWSPYEVILHFIQAEHTNWLPRARHILAGERRPFDPFDQTGQFSENQTKSMGELLATFAELRRDNIAALLHMQLSTADLRRTGQHPEFGEVTLGQLLATWVVHDLNHVGQIVQTMANVYANAVGPWRRYLAILPQQE